MPNDRSKRHFDHTKYKTQMNMKEYGITYGGDSQEPPTLPFLSDHQHEVDFFLSPRIRMMQIPRASL